MKSIFNTTMCPSLFLGYIHYNVFENITYTSHGAVKEVQFVFAFMFPPFSIPVVGVYTVHLKTKINPYFLGSRPF